MEKKREGKVNRGRERKIVKEKKVRGDGEKGTHTGRVFLNNGALTATKVFSRLNVSLHI